VRTGKPSQLMKNSREGVTATHAVETGAATWLSKKARNTTEEVATKRVEEERAAKRAEAEERLRAADRAARVAPRGLMAPALPKQGNQGGGWLSKVSKEFEAVIVGQVGLASDQGTREPGWASTMTKTNDCRGKDRGNNADPSPGDG